jgi:hypothetical protein
MGSSDDLGSIGTDQRLERREVRRRRRLRRLALGLAIIFVVFVVASLGAAAYTEHIPDSTCESRECHTNGLGAPGRACSSCHGANHSGLTDCRRCHSASAYCSCHGGHPPGGG